MTLISHLFKAIKNPDSGIVFVKSGGGEEKMAYLEIYVNALKVLGDLQRGGIKPADEVIIQIDDNKTFLIAFWACILGGIIPVPVATGSQEGQKLKIFNIWKCLLNPYLLCDQLQLDRLEKTVAAGTDQLIFREIRSRSIIPGGGTDHGDMADPGDQSLAYIQFSSGSTGDPKGVRLTHDNLISNVSDIVKSLQITDQDTLVSWLPLTHDMGMIGVHLTGLYAGINVIMMPTGSFIRTPLLWMEKTSIHRGTVLYSPNFGLQYLLSAMKQDVQQNWNLTSVRIVVNGAEAINATVCEKFISELGKYGLNSFVILPAYGLAEAAVEVSCVPVNTPLQIHSLKRTQLNVGEVIRYMAKGSPGSVDFVDVGYPVSLCKVRVCNDFDGELADSTIGHIQIKGKNVTAGYYNNPGATAKLFTEDQWLKTGDVGFMVEGRLTVTGRYKNIIIVNGRNYFPQDIEQVVIMSGMAELGKIVACSVFGGDNLQEEPALFILHKGDFDTFFITADRIRNRIVEELDIYIDKIIPVKRIPKTTSGKVQHYALAESYRNGGFNAYLTYVREKESLSTDQSMTNEHLAVNIEKVCRELLGRRIAHDDNLLNQGMSSLMLMKLLSRVRSLTGRDLSIGHILRNATIDGICLAIVNHLERENLPELVRLDGIEYSLLSSQQARIFTEYLLDKESTKYNLTVKCQIDGVIDGHALNLAFRSILEQHEVLRCSFDWNGLAPIVRINDIGDITPDFKEISLNGSSTVFTQWLEEEKNNPFVLEDASQCRLRLFSISETETIIVFIVHHIITDGWSLTGLLYELSVRYNAYLRNEVTPVTPSEQFQYKDYVYWQNKLSDTEALKRQAEFWHRNLAAMDEPVCFHGKSTPAKVDSIIVENFTASLKNDAVGILDQIAADHYTTRFVIVIALLNTLLYRYTNKRDLVIGTDLSGRTSSQLEQVSGYLINTLCIRTKIDPACLFSQLIEETKENFNDVLNNQHYPFERLVEYIAPAGGFQRNPLFSILVLYQNIQTNAEAAHFNGMKGNSQLVPGKEGFTDLVLEFDEKESGLQFNIQYNTELYSSRQIAAFADHFRSLLGGVGYNQQLPLSAYHFLGESEQNDLLKAPAAIIDAEQIRPIHLSFEESAARTPHALAINGQNKIYSYEGLNKLTNQLARKIKNTCQINPGDAIGFLVNRNENIVIAILAILKSGGSYVAIDPEYPTARCEAIIAHCRMKILLTDLHFGSKISLFDNDVPVLVLDEGAENEDGTNLPYDGSMDDISYITYTSGTTGAPKGILVTHATLAGYVKTFQEYFQIGGDDVFIQQASVAFDTIVEEIFPSLISSACVVIAPNGGKDIHELTSLIKKFKVTILSTTPLVVGEFNKIDHIEEIPLRILISGGEALYSWQIDRLQGFFDIYNSYGPSETTVCASYKKIHHIDNITIGKPIPGRAIYILDENLNLLPKGAAGEIFISGGLAKGYLNDPLETAKRFVTCPWNLKLTLFRSGDLARWDEFGELEILGRIDNQVKVRGHRVELEEVESALNRYPAIKVAIVLQEKTDAYLTAFIMLNHVILEDVLRSYLSNILPLYMIPSRFIKIDHIPYTLTGKTDKRALFSKFTEEIQFTQGKAMPETAMENMLLALCHSVLGTESYGVADNFFNYGGNSIKAIKLINLLYKRTGFKVPVRNLFIYPTVKLLADSIALHDVSLLEPIKRVMDDQSYPLSPAQHRFWMMCKLADFQQSLNEQACFEINQVIDPEILKVALNGIATRHEILRTVFKEVEDVPRQFILHPAACPVCMDFVDLSAVAIPELMADEVIKEQAERIFNLELGPLYAVTLIKCGDQKFILSLVIHHIVTDDWSSSLFLKELSLSYSAFQREDSSFFANSPLQYKDYVNWVNQQITSGVFKSEQVYWESIFNKPVEPLNFPADRQRPFSKTYKGDTVSVTVNQLINDKIHGYCKSNDVSLFMFLLSVKFVLLARYTGQNDIVIGCPVNGRDHPDTADIMGFFVNLLPIRIDLNTGSTFAELLKTVKQASVDAFSNQQYPFDLLVNSVITGRDMSRNPLFDVLLTLSSDFPDPNEPVGDQLKLKKMKRKSGQSKYDFSLYCEESTDGLDLVLEYDTALFFKSRMEKFLEHYVSLIGLLVEEPQAILAKVMFLSGNETDKLLNSFNETAVLLPYKHVLEMINEHSANYPDKLAVVFREQRFSYGEIHRKSECLAAYLINDLQICKDDNIGLIIDRSAFLIIAILAVWKAGAVYIPISVDTPELRVKSILEQSGAEVILTDENTVNQLLSYPILQTGKKIIEIDDDLMLHNYPETRGPVTDRAYVMFTSGSTGKPKGVKINHHAIINTLLDLNNRIGLSSKDSLLAISSYTFDISIVELFWPLINGAHVIIADQDTVNNTSDLVKLMEFARPTVLQATPALWVNIIDIGWEGDQELTAITCGEALTSQLKDQLLDRTSRLWNMYGPTETTIFSAGTRIYRSVPVTIGRPISNTQIYILDKEMMVVPAGVPGEIYIAGCGVSEGYLNQPEMTNLKFVRNVLNNPHLSYRTGDIGRWTDDGRIQLLGRADDQVKIRGFRMEIGEIEMILSQHPGVIKNAVIVQESKNGEKSLIAFVVLKREQGNIVSDIRVFMSQELPSYMIPTAFMQLDAMPLNHNGKIDRNALRGIALGPNLLSGNQTDDPFHTAMELRLKQIWRDLLEMDDFGMDDDFFNLGGHSLKANKMINHIYHQMGVKVKLKDLFSKSTIRQLSAFLEELQQTQYDVIDID